LVSSQDQFALARQFAFHFFVHFLVRDAGAAHFVLMLRENFANFVIEAVLNGQLFHHALANALGDRISGLDLDQFAFDKLLDQISNLKHDMAGKLLAEGRK